MIGIWTGSYEMLATTWIATETVEPKTGAGSTLVALFSTWALAASTSTIASAWRLLSRRPTPASATSLLTAFGSKGTSNPLP